MSRTRGRHRRRSRARERRSSGVVRFLGIPYAAPPVGGLRSEHRSRRSALDGRLRADTLPPHAPARSPLEQVIEGRARDDQSEAGCLALNVWTPGRRRRASRPVMVFVHGGAFVWGSSASPMYDGARSPRTTTSSSCHFNYRLGSLASRMRAAGGPEFAGSGSVGRAGRRGRAALGGRATSAAFGGDPGNVTVFGESAGAMSVGTLLALPEARGLFHKAILQSGAASNVATIDEASLVLEETCELLGVGTDVTALQSLPVERLVEAQAELTSRHLRDGLLYRPVVDGTVLDRGRSPRSATVWRRTSRCSSARTSTSGGCSARSTRVRDARRRRGAPKDRRDVRRRPRRRRGDVPKRVGDAPARARPRVRRHRRDVPDPGDPARRGPAGRGRRRVDVPAHLAVARVRRHPRVRPRPRAPLGVQHARGARARGSSSATSRRAGLARDVQATWAAFARHGDPGRGALGSGPATTRRGARRCVLDTTARLRTTPLSEERALYAP